MASVDRHRSESRADLEGRFRVLATVLVSARERCIACVWGCPACELIQEPVPLPAAVLARGHEPREDLENGVELVAERLSAVAGIVGAPECPARAHVAGFMARCVAKAAE